MIFRTQFSTVLGEMSAAATEQGVCFLNLRKTTAVKIPYSWFLPAENSGNRRKSSSPALLESQLQDYFAGKRMIFTVPLVLRERLFSKSLGCIIVCAVWQHRYLQYAGGVIILTARCPGCRAGQRDESGFRAGTVSPRYRQNGELTGYAGGTDRKARLLAHENRLKEHQHDFL